MTSTGAGRPRVTVVGDAAEPSAETGAATMFVSVAAIGLLALAGLVVDGGAKVRAAQRADRSAAEAARAAGQALSREDVLAGVVKVDPVEAVRLAQSYLARAGVDGSASVGSSGAELQVRTTITASTVFLGLVGVESFKVDGSARASLIKEG